MNRVYVAMLSGILSYTFMEFVALILFKQISISVPTTFELCIISFPCAVSGLFTGVYVYDKLQTSKEK